ncbi:MAG: adenosylmethionine decarboxylase [Fimbriimonadales bacterium]|nr:adenosylmethionine decarboxylase [Fimbriimonadales bacterium]MDW8051645.1 adenosylmethionine decarboxylase [Armatimonadota bacterium]
MSKVGILGRRPARSTTSIATWVLSLWRSARAWLAQAVASLTSKATTNAPAHCFEYEIAPRSLRQDGSRTLGTHLLVELHGCNGRTLERVAHVERALVQAAHESNARIVSHFFHEFEPYGVSGVVVIEESHYTIHTWPEHRYAAVDLFYCSETVDAERALEVLRRAFEPEKVDVMLVRRGVLQHTPG